MTKTMPEYQNLIAEEFVPSESKNVIEDRGPATGELISHRA